MLKCVHGSHLLFNEITVLTKENLVRLSDFVCRPSFRSFNGLLLFYCLGDGLDVSDIICQQLWLSALASYAKQIGRSGIILQNVRGSCS